MNTKELILLVALLAMVGTMIGVAVAAKSERREWNELTEDEQKRWNENHPIGLVY